MRFERTPNTFIENELYKLCDGEITRQFVGNYSTNSTWQPADIFRTIIGTCLEHTSLEDMCSAPETPSADTILRRCNELKWTDTEQLTNGWLFEIASRLQFPKKAKLTISIDIHSIPYYGNRSYFWVTGMKRKKGTNYAISFLTVTITTRKIRCPVAMRLMTKERMKDKLAVIEDILAELRVWLPITRVLMDRGFCQKDIITLLGEIGLEWLITAKHRGEVKKAHNEILQCIENLATEAGVNIKDRLALGKWARKQGLDTFRVEQVLTSKKGIRVPLVAALVRLKTNQRDSSQRFTYELFMYLTNLDVSARYIVKLYGKRWMIETDYRCINDFQAITNSISPQLRIILFGLAVTLNGLWVVFSILQNRLVKVGHFSIDENTRFYVQLTFRLVCIARWFCRYLRDEILPLLTFQGGDA